MQANTHRPSHDTPQIQVLGFPEQRGAHTQIVTKEKENYLKTYRGPKQRSLQWMDQEPTMSQPSQNWIDKDNNHLSR